MTGMIVGSIVESKCGKCDDVTGHVIMALVGGAIVKVECRACGSVHKYRPADKPGKAPVASTVRRGPDGAIIQSTPTPRSVAAKKTSASGGKKAEPKQSVPSELWQAVLRRRESETPLPYSITGSFPEKSLIEHSVFGLGQVMSFIAPDKIDVLFEKEIKRLKCG